MNGSTNPLAAIKTNQVGLWVFRTINRAHKWLERWRLSSVQLVECATVFYERAKAWSNVEIARDAELHRMKQLFNRV